MSSACSGSGIAQGRSTPAPAGAQTRDAALPGGDVGLPDRSWAPLPAPAHFIVLPVPDRKGWTVRDRTGSWLVASHEASQSELRIIGWRQDVVSNRERCERDARSTHIGLPLLQPEELVEERELRAPEGFDTAVRAAVQRRASNGLEATALAIGANVRRCIAVVFRTRATGQHAEQIVAQRLRLIIDGTLSRARNWSVEDRAKIEQGLPPP